MNNLNYDETAVRKLHDEIAFSFNSLDVEKLLSLHSENVILMEPGIPLVCGKQEARKFFEKYKKEHLVLKLSLQILEIEVFGIRAFVRGQVLKTMIKNNGKPVHDIGKFISLSKKQSDGSWLRTHAIVNSDTTDDETFSPVPVKISMGFPDRLWKN